MDNLMLIDSISDNPFLVKKYEYYNDFHMSEFYTQSKKQEIGLLDPIQLYMDETTLDCYSKLLFHSLVMHLLIFNRKTRNLSILQKTLS